MRINVGKELHAQVVAQYDFGRRMGVPQPLRGGGWCVSPYQSNEIHFLNAQLRPQGSVALSVKGTDWLSFAVAPNADLLALSDENRVVIFDAQGNICHELPHQSWPAHADGACAFDARGRLWCALGVERLALVDPSSGAVLAEGDIPNDEGTFSLRPCQDANCMVVDIACGQDGASTYFVSFSDGQLHAQWLPQDGQGGVFADVSPDEQQCVFLNQDGDDLRVFGFPTGKLQGRVEAAPLFEGSEYEEDALEYQAQYVQDGPLIVTTRSNRLLCFDPASLSLLGTLWPDGYELQWFDERGQPTINPNEYFDCQGDIFCIRRAGKHRLLIVRDERLFQLVNLGTAT